MAGKEIMIKCLSKRLIWFFRNTIEMEHISLKDNNSSMHTEIFVSQWEWHLLKVSRKYGKLSSSVIRTEMEESTRWRCSPSSREFREFSSSKEDLECISNKVALVCNNNGDYEYILI